MEAYHIPAETIARIRAAKERAGRVIAVGTTVVRALETAAMSGDFEKPSGTTNLYIDASFELKVVDGLITGLHEPESSHLDLLTAFLDAASIETIYRDAVAKGYLWHEFGDVHVIL
jgi:S-adenosylmethionine:tRNA ribosyltransferase-isomerase